MWRIDLNNATLHQAGSEYTLLNPVLTSALNAVDKLEFDITTAHPLYDVVRDGIMSQTYHVMLDGVTVSRGRILSCTEQPLTSTMHVICEGDLGRLNDAVMEPYNVDGAAKSAYTVFNSYIAAYNRHCGSIYPMYVGNVTINDNQLVRLNESPSNLFEELMEKTVNSSTGGYVGVRYDAQNKCFIDWLESPNVAGAQNVTAGINILELSDERNGADIITAILPVGASNDDGTRVLPDADLPDGSYVKGDVYYRSFPWSYTVAGANNTTIERNACVLYNKKLVNKYGWHCAVVTWEDVTLSINLWNKAIKYTRELAFKNKIDIRAIDLADAGYDVDRFKPGQRVPVRCGQLDSTMMVQSCEWHLDDPSATVISFGESVTSTSYTSSATATANSAANAASSAVAMASSAPTKYAPISHEHAASDITSGTLDSARLPIASTSTLGAVKVDGDTITIDGNGVISSSGGGTGSVTGVKGNAESTYRTGNVNLTPANIGAAASSHEHAATDITSGTLGIANGGTGQSSVSTESTVSTLITAASGTTITAATFKQWGKLAMLTVSFKRTSSWAANAQVDVGTVKTGYRPALLVNGGNANVIAHLNGSGVMRARNMTGAAIATTTQQDIGFTFLLP